MLVKNTRLIDFGTSTCELVDYELELKWSNITDRAEMLSMPLWKIYCCNMQILGMTNQLRIQVDLSRSSYTGSSTACKDQKFNLQCMTLVSRALFPGRGPLWAECRHGCMHNVLQESLILAKVQALKQSKAPSHMYWWDRALTIQASISERSVLWSRLRPVCRCNLTCTWARCRHVRMRNFSLDALNQQCEARKQAL